LLGFVTLMLNTLFSFSEDFVSLPYFIGNNLF